MPRIQQTIWEQHTGNRFWYLIWNASNDDARLHRWRHHLIMGPGSVSKAKRKKKKVVKFHAIFFFLCVQSRRSGRRSLTFLDLEFPFLSRASHVQSTIFCVPLPVRPRNAHAVAAAGLPVSSGAHLGLHLHQHTHTPTQSCAHMFLERAG